MVFCETSQLILIKCFKGVEILSYTVGLVDFVLLIHAEDIFVYSICASFDTSKMGKEVSYQQY